MAENTEEMNIGFMDMEVGDPETPMMPETNPLEEMGLEQLQMVMTEVMSRFKGGLDEVTKLVEDDKEDIKKFKETQGEFDNIIDTLEMSNDDDDPTKKFILASVPGSSLTGNLENTEKNSLGVYEWETPPQIENIVDAFTFVKENKNTEPTKQNVLKLLYAGVPAEAISRTVTFRGFLEGLWTPDITELLIIPLMLELVADAKEEGFTPKIFNDFDDDMISDEEVLDIMEDLNPDEFNAIKQESDMLSRMPNIEEDPEPIIGSFLDMAEGV